MQAVGRRVGGAEWGAALPGDSPVCPQRRPGRVRAWAQTSRPEVLGEHVCANMGPPLFLGVSDVV